MYHSVEHIENIFKKINPKYWIIREKDKNGTPKFTSEHGTFADCLELLPHGVYNISMRNNANATKDAPNYTFQHGDAVQGVQGVGNPQKADAVLMGGNNWGGSSMMGMMMMMYKESQNTNQALLMQLNQTHIQGVQTTHAKDMELFKLQMSMNQNKSAADKLLGVLVSPNMPKILEAVSGMVNGQPVAIGRLTTEGAVPAPVHNTDNAQAAETETLQAFDPNNLTPEQRAVYDRGVRINAIMAKIQAKFPDGDPVDQMETAADVILSMPEDKLNALMMDSFTQSIGL